jgi:hypothetical protein
MLKISIVPTIIFLCSNLKGTFTNIVQLEIVELFRLKRNTLPAIQQVENCGGTCIITNNNF